jgi:hypothetical protein
MHTALFVTIIALSIHGLECTSPPLKPRYSTRHCKWHYTQTDCEKLAKIPLIVEETFKGKGYACAWKGFLSKSCDKTTTVVDLIKPDPSKLTQSVEACLSIMDKYACSISFSAEVKGQATACYWSTIQCHAHGVGFPYEQLPAKAIEPKFNGKTTVSKCRDSPAVPCEQKVEQRATTSKGKVCVGCAKRGSSCISYDTSHVFFCE